MSIGGPMSGNVFVSELHEEFGTVEWPAIPVVEWKPTRTLKHCPKRNHIATQELISVEYHEAEKGKVDQT